MGVIQDAFVIQNGALITYNFLIFSQIFTIDTPYIVCVCVCVCEGGGGSFVIINTDSLLIHFVPL